MGGKQGAISEWSLVLSRSLKVYKLQSYLGEIQDITLPRDDYEVLIFAFGVTDYINDDEKLKQILRHVSADAVLLIQPSPRYLMTRISNVGAH